MTKSKDIGKAFKEKFDNFDQTSSNLSWESLEPKLAKTKNYSILYWFLASGMLAIVFLTVILAPDKTPINEHTTQTNDTLLSEKACEIKLTSINGNSLRSQIVSSSISKYTVKTEEDLIEESNKVEKHFNYKFLTPWDYDNLKRKDSIEDILTDKRGNSNIIKKSSTYTSYLTSVTNSSATNTYSKKNKNSISSENKKEGIHDTTNDFGKIITSSTDSISNIVTVALNDSVKVPIKKKDTLIKMNRLAEKPFQRYIVTVHADMTYLIISKGSILNNNLSENSGTGKISVGFGIFFSSYLNENIAFRIGYARLNLSAYITNVSNAQLSSSFNYLKGKNDNNNLKYKMNYDEFTFGLQYVLFDKNIKTSAITGISTQLLKTSEIFINTDKQSIRNNKNSKKFNMSLNLGSNFSYKLNDKISVIVEPLIQFSLGERTNDGGNVKPANFRVLTGVSYEF